MSPRVNAEVRNLKFDVEDAPRYWLNGRKAETIFWNNLSVFFPEGERFFIRTVRAHRHDIQDPQLADEARTFYGQEAMHTREHVRYNDMLRSQGYDVDAMDRRVGKLLGFVAWLLPTRWQLAVTCALEHFTALLAHWVLDNPEMFEGADGTMLDLWRWHAAEENEHKAVAFDVYKAAGGGTFIRLAVMFFATIIFGAKVFEHQVRMMHQDGILWSFGEWRALFVRLFTGKSGLQRLLPAYLDYYRPSFHPWQHDNRDLLEAWKRDLESSAGYQAVQGV